LFSERGEVYTGLWWAKLRERDHREDLALDGRLTVKLIFKKEAGKLDWFDLI
jgi:hypothetical protein